MRKKMVVTQAEVSDTFFPKNLVLFIAEFTMVSVVLPEKGANENLMLIALTSSADK